MKSYRNAVVKWNGGRGALLCSRCGVVVDDGFDHADVETLCYGCNEGTPPPAKSEFRVGD